MSEREVSPPVVREATRAAEGAEEAGDFERPEPRPLTTTTWEAKVESARNGISVAATTTQPAAESTNDQKKAGNKGDDDSGRAEESKKIDSTSVVPSGSSHVAVATESVTIAQLPAAVRARMDDVLHSVEDEAIRKDTRLINFLGEVEEAQALAALNEYQSAISETSIVIRNKSAYMMGILRKHKQGQKAPSGNGAERKTTAVQSAIGRMGAGPNGLAPRIAARFEELYESNFISKKAVDQRCLDFFRDVTLQQAELAMDEFAQSDIKSICNISAFLMSILRKHQESSTKPTSAGSFHPCGLQYEHPPMFGFGYGYGGFMDPHMDYYAPYYGRPPAPIPPMFNAFYGQPFPFPPPPLTQVPMMYPRVKIDALPTSVQYRIEQLCRSGFCKASEIDDRCRKFLGEVPEAVAMQAIDEFSAVDREEIRNVPAYLMGVIRKHADRYNGAENGFSMLRGYMVQPPPRGMIPMPNYAGMKRRAGLGEHCEANKMHRAQSTGPGTNVAVMERLATASSRVQQGVRDMLAKGIVNESEVDGRVTTAMLQLSEDQGVAAIDEFCQVDMCRIRNKSAYLMGLLKRYRTGAPAPPSLEQDRS